jgi:hypothetical protein
MLIVAIAWIYVVGLMALTEPTVVAGIVTFLFYCVVPLGILFYLAGARKRKARRVAQEQAAHAARIAARQAAGAADTAAAEPGAAQE